MSSLKSLYNRSINTLEWINWTETIRILTYLASEGRRRAVKKLLRPVDTTWHSLLCSLLLCYLTLIWDRPVCWWRTRLGDVCNIASPYSLRMCARTHTQSLGPGNRAGWLVSLFCAAQLACFFGFTSHALAMKAVAYAGIVRGSEVLDLTHTHRWCPSGFFGLFTVSV